MNVEPENFEYIYNIYMQNGMSTSELYASEPTLEHFGITYKYILINQEISNVQGAITDKPIKKAPNKETNKPEKIDYYKLLTEGNEQLNSKFPHLFICANKHKYTRFLEQVKKYKLPYMPFRVVFAEGTLSYDDSYGDLKGVSITMVPIFASFSEENNVMFMRLLLNRNNIHSYSHKPYTECLFTLKNKNGDENENEDEISKNGTEVEVCDFNYYEDDDADDDKCRYQALLSHESSSHDKQLIRLNLKFTCNWSESDFVNWTMDAENINCPIVLKICSDRNPNTILDRTEHYIITKGSNDTTILAIEPKHMKPIYDRIIELDLFEAIKSQLDEVGYKFSQQYSNDFTFCNESVYGNFNFLMVHGFMHV